MGKPKQAPSWRANHGTAQDAIDFLIGGYADCGPGEEVAFLQAWREGALDEWPEYYTWLNACRAKGANPHG